jgi:nitronate monooxygenase
LRLSELLGVELPIVQAPMAGVQDSALAIAVCNAGGLGSLPCALLSPAAMRDQLARIAAQTRHPYNVNFFCHTPPVPDPQREAAWRAALAPYYRELGIDPGAVPAAASRTPFSDEAAAVLGEFKPPIVSFHFGLPAPAMLARLRSWGAKILSSATTLDEARWLEAHGVDAIIAQGREAGGHRGMFLSEDVTGQAATLALLPQIIAAVNVPVIAAGGIGDARTVAAAMALGSAGVQVGTAYLLCPEATTTAVHRAALKSAAAGDTAITNVFTGRPARAILNRLMRELGPMSPHAPAFPLAAAAVAPLRARAEGLGRGDFSPLWAGEYTSGCKEIPAADLTRELAEGFRPT